MLKAKIEVGARFKFITSKANGHISKETAWFNNLVLDAGLDAMGGGGTADISHVWVGTGNSTPTPTQTGLDNTLAGTSTVQGSQTGVQTSSLPYYYWMRRTFRFGLGVAAGNLSEVGLGNSSRSMFNRALIKDNAGNPTTVTVLSDEFLDVVVELRVYPKTNFSGQFQLLDKFGALVSEHTYTGNAILFQDSIAWSIRSVGGQFLGVGGTTCNPSNTSYPNTTGWSTEPVTISRPSNLRSIVVSRTVGLNEANEFSHKGFRFGVGNLLTTNPSQALIGYKWDVEPPITKTNLQTLRYQFELSWNRYEPT
ncbi:hypothetical protein E5093_09675 [Acinetobacter indicus]|uniref:hypothetical protein n=1 Tax=Acinetobacter indicus TaxID=756892 RepID=UPI00159F4F99|nr:hypothetical protein [Acinetobacter indicus]QLB59831.1 hypothetical protein E5093_09675 [Acinetobacter indicus]